MKKIIFFAFLLRIVVALSGEHGDVINYYWWAKDLWDHSLLGFYDRNIANAMRPTYPPVTSYLFFATAALHQLVWKMSWILNQNLRIFPSNFIFWLESAKGWYFFNKLPAITADMFIIHFLFKFGQNLKNKKAGLFSAAAFAFLPPFWYNSSLWGQTDSIYALPLLASFYFLHKKHLSISMLLFTLSLLTKPTGAFVAPVYFVWWLKRTNTKTILFSIGLVFAEILLLYFPFHHENLVLWIVKFYQRSLGGELSYIVANTFNVWSLFFGFDNRPDTVLFLGIPVYIIGNILFTVSALICMWFAWIKTSNTPTIIFLSSILSFCAFLFLPRMHERYFYPCLLFLTLFAGTETKIRKIFFGLAIIHFINLYHFFWVPRLDWVVSFLSIHFVEKMIILTNFLMFGLLLNFYKNNWRKI